MPKNCEDVQWNARELQILPGNYGNYQGISKELKDYFKEIGELGYKGKQLTGIYRFGGIYKYCGNY